MKIVEVGPVGSPSELNSFRKPTSTQEGGILFSLNHILRSPRRWQYLGRATAIIFTTASGLVGAAAGGGASPVKAETLGDGNVPGCVLPTPPKGVEFKLGFKALADLEPCVVGAPLENEHWGANGDSLQITSNGLMAWRKADNWTAFTDGVDTYLNGPAGLAVRPNDKRFDWEGPEAAGVKVTPHATPTIVAQATATPTRGGEVAPAAQQAVLRNMFTDTYPLPTGLVRRQFTPDQVVNINGIEFKGKEFIAADYAKNMVSFLKRAPEYETFVKKYIKSIEVSNSSMSSSPQVIINDILGDGGNFMERGFNIPDTFSVQISIADLVYNTKFTELAANGSNNAGRFTMGPITDPQLEKAWNIKQKQAIIEACKAGIDFATKAKLIPGIIDTYQARKTLVEAQLRALQ